MTIDVGKTLFNTKFSGLHNYTSKDFSVSVPGQNLAIGGYVKYSASTAMDNDDAVSQAMLQYTGLETQWRYCDGIVIVNKPIYSAPNYQIQSFNYFVNGVLYVDTVISNQTGGIVAIPAFTVTVRANMYLAPF